MFRIWVFGRTFSFIVISSCSRTCSRPDSTNPYCASCNSNLCSSVCRCSSPMHLLAGSTWSSCFPRSDLTWFSKWSWSQVRRISVPEQRTPDQVSLLRRKQCVGLHQSFVTFTWMRSQNFLSLGLSKLCTHLSLLHDQCNGFPWAFWAYSGEVSSIFCNSPSSRSESAMLTIDSSRCIWDWR